MTAFFRRLYVSLLFRTLLGAVVVTFAIAASGAQPPTVFLPNLALIVAYVLLGKGSSLTETAAVAFIGLLSDFLSGDVVGSGALGLLAGFALFRGFVKRLDVSQTGLKILLFPLFATVAVGIEWILSSVASVTFLPINGAIWQIVMTSGIFAVLAALASIGKPKRQTLRNKRF